MKIAGAVYNCIDTCKAYLHTVATKDRRGCDRMVFGFTTTCAVSAYHYERYYFEPCSWRGILDTTVCDKVCQ